jgi:hypothetical protein
MFQQLNQKACDVLIFLPVNSKQGKTVVCYTNHGIGFEKQNK